MNLERPMPPEKLVAGLGQFEPAHDVARWVRNTFINEGSRLHNPDHAHLEHAQIGFLWTNEPNERKGRMIIGTCQLMPPAGDKWSVGRAQAQIYEWFPEADINFLITLYAPWCADADDLSFCALLEHEMSHAGQATDKFGAPAFDRETGQPKWSIIGHSVEEFTGVVRRYGAWSHSLQEMKEAMNSDPEVGAAAIANACGSCRVSA